MLMRSVSIGQVFSIKKTNKACLILELTVVFFFETQELTSILTVLSLVPNVPAILSTSITNIDKQLKRPSSK
jgi:hypothetical protein